MAELEKIKKERAEEQERKVRHIFRLPCLRTFYKQHSVSFKKCELHLFVFNEFLSSFFLGARAKGRGREDPHGEYLKRKSIN